MQCRCAVCGRTRCRDRAVLRHNGLSVSVTRRGFSPPQVQRPIPSRGLKGLQGHPIAHGIATYRTSPLS